MHKLSILFIAMIMLASCGKKETKTEEEDFGQPADDAVTEAPAAQNPDYDAERGLGKFKDVEVGDKLDMAMAKKGESVYSVKCSSCHKLTDEKLVGPGWKDVTKRHKPEWIMNFITNPDEMLDKDPKAKAMLEICLVRMPNQQLSDDEARNLFEYMRQNDGVK